LAYERILIKHPSFFRTEEARKRQAQNVSGNSLQKEELDKPSPKKVPNDYYIDLVFKKDKL
jgi:hypothetical protein